MSYTGSKTQIGAGTTLSIGTSSPPIVGEILDIVRSGAKMGTEDSSNLESLSDEFIATLLSPGSVKVTVQRYSADTGQLAVETAFNTKAIETFTITLPKTAAQTVAGDTIAFPALVEDFNDLNISGPKKKITSEYGLKIQGGVSANPWVRTAGS